MAFQGGTAFFVAKGSGLITKTSTAWRDAARETISTGRLAYTVYGTEINLPDPATMLVRDLKSELESYGIRTEGFMKKHEMVDALNEARLYRTFGDEIPHQYHFDRHYDHIPHQYNDEPHVKEPKYREQAWHQEQEWHKKPNQRRNKNHASKDYFPEPIKMTDDEVKPFDTHWENGHEYTGRNQKFNQQYQQTQESHFDQHYQGTTASDSQLVPEISKDIALQLEMEQNCVQMSIAEIEAKLRWFGINTDSFMDRADFVVALAGARLNEVRDAIDVPSEVDSGEYWP